MGRKSNLSCSSILIVGNGEEKKANPRPPPNHLKSLQKANQKSKAEEKNVREEEKTYSMAVSSSLGFKY